MEANFCLQTRINLLVMENEKDADFDFLNNHLEKY